MNEEKTYECAYCHRKWNSPEERMKCEQKCYAERVAEQERQKKEQQEALLRIKEEARKVQKIKKIKEIQQEYDKFIADVKQFNGEYKEPVKIDGKYYDFSNDTLFSSGILDPFEEWLNGRF